MMRPQNKSRSRNKNNNGNNGGNNNNRRQFGNIVNRVFDSAGPEGKVRGTPQQIIEKYQSLARDAQLSNDRVAAENFLQHSEHYSRMLGEALSQQAEMRQNGEGQPMERQNGYESDESPESQPQSYGNAPSYLPQSVARDANVLPPNRSFESEQPQPEMAAFEPADEINSEGLVATPENPQPNARNKSASGRNRNKKPSADTGPEESTKEGFNLD